MADSVIEAIYEYQKYDGKCGRWVVDEKNPWLTEDRRPTYPPDEFPLPDSDWSWVTNWKYEVKQNCTDREGWEYGSASSRLGVPGRDPKVEKTRGDKARRRMWSRQRRRKDATQTLSETTPRVQQGLKSIHLVRVKIEEILRNDLNAADSEEMMILVSSVRTKIKHIYKLLDIVEAKGVSPSEMTIINKLRNDIMKEETAISRVVDRKVAGRKEAFPAPAAKRQTTAEKATVPEPADGFVPLGQSGKTLSFAGSGAGRSGGGGGGMEQAAAAAASSGGVKKGTAGSFDPSLLSASGGPGRDGAEHGVFVARSDYDQRQVVAIEKKLKAVSEVDVQTALIEERSVAIEEIHRDIAKVKELYNDLAILVEQQQSEVDRIYENADGAHAKTAVAFNQILEAEQLQREGCILS